MRKRSAQNLEPRPGIKNENNIVDTKEENWSTTVSAGKKMPLPGDDDNSSDNESGFPSDKYIGYKNKQLQKEQGKYEKPTGNDRDRYNNGLGVNGLMKAYIGKCSIVFDTLSEMGGVTDAEKLQYIPIMLIADALSYFSSRMQHCDTYEGAIEMIRTLYNSDEKLARILTTWKGMQLSDEMSKEQDS